MDTMEQKDRCAICREPIGEAGGYRHVGATRDAENNTLLVGMVPLCPKHLAEFDQRPEA